MGSVHSISSSQVTAVCCLSSKTSQINLIVDSGCIKHMFPNKALFTTYKYTPSSFVGLADKSKVPWHGIGTVLFSLLDKTIRLHDVLQFPDLQSPLLSAHCFHCLKGCSFMVDDAGSFLTFPTFILPVDNTTDCMVACLPSLFTVIDFDSCLAGSAAAVSNNTRF